MEKPDNLELLQLREDLKILSKQNAHKEHMENLRLKTELAIRDLALEQMMTDYLEDMRLLKYEEPKESIVLYLNKAEAKLNEIKGERNDKKRGGNKTIFKTKVPEITGTNTWLAVLLA